jgi:hypothetical protein
VNVADFAPFPFDETPDPILDHRSNPFPREIPRNDHRSFRLVYQPAIKKSAKKATTTDLPGVSPLSESNLNTCSWKDGANGRRRSGISSTLFGIPLPLGQLIPVRAEDLRGSNGIISHCNQQIDDKINEKDERSVLDGRHRHVMSPLATPYITSTTCSHKSVGPPWSLHSGPHSLARCAPPRLRPRSFTGISEKPAAPPPLRPSAPLSSSMTRPRKDHLRAIFGCSTFALWGTQTKKKDDQFSSSPRSSGWVEGWKEDVRSLPSECDCLCVA